MTAPAAAQDFADRIWSGGSIVTMNEKALRAEAVAERGGKIVAVGTRAQVMNTITSAMLTAKVER